MTVDAPQLMLDKPFPSALHEQTKGGLCREQCS